MFGKSNVNCLITYLFTFADDLIKRGPNIIGKRVVK